jgi:adenosylhomocysteine nucleosidase
VAILGALHRELADIRSQFKIQHRGRKNGVCFWMGYHESRRIILVQTGVGPSQARHAASVILAAYPVEVLISVGFACALQSRMKIGDLVVGERFSFFNRVAPISYPADDKLLRCADAVSENYDIAHGVPASVLRGSILTVQKIVVTAGEKRFLADTTGAVALDMESAAIAAVATEAKVAYLSIRAISDLVDEDLGEISKLFSPEGKLRPLKVILYLVSHPGGVIHLNRLRKHTAVASKRLGWFIHDYLHRLN